MYVTKNVIAGQTQWLIMRMCNKMTTPSRQTRKRAMAFSIFMDVRLVFWLTHIRTL